MELIISLFYVVEVPKFDSEEQKRKFHASKPLSPEGEDLREFTEDIEIILQTANENEYQAAVTFMEPPPAKLKNRAFVFPSAGIVVGMFAGHKVALIHTDVGGSCADYIYRALSYFTKVKYIIAVGVCYAFDRSTNLVMFWFPIKLVTSRTSNLIRWEKFSIEEKQLMSLLPLPQCFGRT